MDVYVLRKKNPTSQSKNANKNVRYSKTSQNENQE